MVSICNIVYCLVSDSQAGDLWLKQWCAGSRLALLAAQHVYEHGRALQGASTPRAKGPDRMGEQRNTAFYPRGTCQFTKIQKARTVGRLEAEHPSDTLWRQTEVGVRGGRVGAQPFSLALGRADPE